MARVRVSALAEQDVRDILNDLGRRAGRVVAGRYVADFRRVFRTLAEFPASGAPRSKLGVGARVKLVHPYVVIYDHHDDIVTVLRVIHGHRDITIELMGRSRGVAPFPPG
jgi:plasmid stabilization system protein ParE